MAIKNGSSGPDIIDGTVLGDTIRGLGGNDIIDGKGGVDTLIGGTGADFVFGGAGRDFLVVGDGDTADSEVYDGGTFDNTDTLVISETAAAIVGDFLADFRTSQMLSLEILAMETSEDATAQFSAASFGGAGFSDALGLLGGSGRQTVAIEMRSDTALDLSGWTFANWEISDKIWIVGDDSAETIIGSSQRDWVNAGGGADTLSLGAGNDVVIVDGTQSGDSYAGGAGTDYLISNAESVDLSVATLSGFEVLKLSGPGDQTVILDSSQIGAGLSSTGTLNCVGGTANTVIINVSQSSFSAAGFFFLGFDGDDSIILSGDRGGNVITGGQLGDTIFGNLGIDTLIGGSGNDTLDGGAGGDGMFGGSGDDLYIVDSADDVAAEILVGADPGGLDKVQSSVTHTLSGFIENLTLVGSAALGGTGNGLANGLVGNAGANALNGLGGADRIIGGLGADILTGGAGGDRFILRSAAESGFGVARDRITDFEIGLDKIDLRQVDANTGLAGLQAFTEAAGATLGAGQFRFTEVNGNTIIEFNIDADPTIEMQILLQQAVGVGASDLLL